MKIVLVHRWDGTPDNDWYPWLKGQLEAKGFEVLVPLMPNTSEPDIGAWVHHLREVVGTPDIDTYFIGHSIGCQTILRYLATLPSSVRVGGIIFVAGWFTLQNLEDEDAEAIAQPWVETPIDFSKVMEKTAKISVFLSDNDPYVSSDHVGLFEKNLCAKIIRERGKGHFTAEDGVTEMPEVIAELQRFITKKP